MEKLTVEEAVNRFLEWAGADDSKKYSVRTAMDIVAISVFCDLITKYGKPVVDENGDIAVYPNLYPRKMSPFPHSELDVLGYKLQVTNGKAASDLTLRILPVVEEFLPPYKDIIQDLYSRGYLSYLHENNISDMPEDEVKGIVEQYLSSGVPNIDHSQLISSAVLEKWEEIVASYKVSRKMLKAATADMLRYAVKSVVLSVDNLFNILDPVEIQAIVKDTMTSEEVKHTNSQ